MYFDDRYRIFDSLKYIDLINDNSINYVINNYPNVPISSLNFNVEIYARPFLGWKYNCLSDRGIGLEYISDLSQTIDEFFGKLISLLIISIISFIIYIIIFFFVFI